MKYILRICIAVIAIILALDGVVLVVHGVGHTIESYRNLADPAVEYPLVPALAAVDQFFMALVFFILAIGLVQLFIGDLPFMRPVTFPWLRIDSFIALKVLLWDTFLVTLLMLFFTRLITTPDPDWSILILPAAILMLTLCSFLLKRKH